jgi:hypothetical protein
MQETQLHGGITFINLPTQDIAAKVDLFIALIGYHPRITVRGSAYDAAGNLVFNENMHQRVIGRMDDTVAVDVNGMVTWVHTLDRVWPSVYMW